MKFTAHSDFNTLLYAVALQGRFFNTESSRRIRSAENEAEREQEIKRLIKGVNYEFSERAKREIAQAREQDVRVLGLADNEYPHELLELEDPPLVLFVQGRLPRIMPDKEKFCFGIVGTRKCTPYGHRAARSIARKLCAERVCIVSGLAHGIDAAAHRGALDAAQASVTELHPGIAVLGSGLEHLYPAANRKLAYDLLHQGGAIVSEYGLEQGPRRDLFPRRNRIISGLSRGIAVVEAAKKSGSLITARLALEQNRDVFAVPGPIDSDVSVGSNYLLRQGAELLYSFEQLVDFYPELTLKQRSEEQTALQDDGRENTAEQRVLRALQQSSKADIDELADIAELKAAELLPILTCLELEGKLELGPDKLYVLRSLIDS